MRSEEGDTSCYCGLERARKRVTQEVLTRAMVGLPANTTMGEMVASNRSAGFATDFEAMPSGRRRGRKAARGGASRAASTRIYTRTAAGREKLDAAVADYLPRAKSAWAAGILKAVGGTSPQVRQSLSRLMDAKKLSKKRQKRATEYRWCG